MWKERVNVVHVGNYSMLLNKGLALGNVAAKASVLWLIEVQLPAPISHAYAQN